MGFWVRLFEKKKPTPPTERPRPAKPPEPSGAEAEALLAQAIEIALEVKLDHLPPTPPLTDEAKALADRVAAHFKAQPPSLDAFPQISMRVLQLVSQPEVTYRELGALISRDTALSAAVIRVSNSAYYQGTQEIHSVNDAMSRLGLKEIARLVGVIASRSLFDTRLASERALFGGQANALRHHAVVTALAASGLSLDLRDGQPDRAFMGGILHDIGKSLALRSLASLVLDEGLKIDPDSALVRMVVDHVHVELGTVAHELWKLPPFLYLLAGMHHSRGSDVAAGEGRADFHAVRLASALALFRSERLLHPQAPSEIAESARTLQLKPMRFGLLTAELGRAEEKARALVASE